MDAQNSVACLGTIVTRNDSQLKIWTKSPFMPVLLFECNRCSSECELYTVADLKQLLKEFKNCPQGVCLRMHRQ